MTDPVSNTSAQVRERPIARDGEPAPRAVDELVVAGHTVSAEANPQFGDDRGYFLPVNFAESSKRAYVIQNHVEGTVRAFHGHRYEDKTLFVVRGAFTVVVMCMETLRWKRFTLTEKGLNKIYIPANAYNGFVSHAPDALLLIVSNRTFEESVSDDIRLPYDFLGEDVWRVHHR